MDTGSHQYNKRPEWLKVRYKNSQNLEQVNDILKKYGINTVCQEAVCPNQYECFNNRTATFMILGNNCTRNCTFCAVGKNKPDYIDDSEPIHIAQAVKELGLKHVVITSVTRDDLEDGGANQFGKVIQSIRTYTPEVIIEVLIPDFEGVDKALEIVVNARPHIINHNVETVSRLYEEVRPMAIYERSINLLKATKVMNPDIMTKSGIMVGLGETEIEIIEVMKNLRQVGCDFLTIGQYLAPTEQHHPIIEYIPPKIFDYYREVGLELGFSHVASGPLVRSSYHAQEAYEQNKI